MTSFLTAYTAVPVDGQIMDPKSSVDVVGYLPPRKQIMSILAAGQRLQTARAEEYDFKDGVDTGESDPTRTNDFIDNMILATKVAQHFEGAKLVKPEESSEGVAAPENVEGSPSEQPANG